MSKTKKESGFAQIFKDDNVYNEKTIIGFMSFAVMVITSLVDLTTGMMNMNLEIKEYIYQSFVIITLGSFGIAGLDRFSPAAKIEAERANEVEEEKKEEFDPYA
jgi:membrane-bound ClpP family serine protease